MSWNLVDLTKMTYSYPVAQSADDDKDHWTEAASSDLAPMLYVNVRRHGIVFWMGVPFADIVESSIRILPSLKSDALVVGRMSEEPESSSNVILRRKCRFSDVDVIASPVAHQDASCL